MREYEDLSGFGYLIIGIGNLIFWYVIGGGLAIYYGHLDVALLFFILGIQGPTLTIYGLIKIHKNICLRILNVIIEPFRIIVNSLKPIAMSYIYIIRILKDKSK